MYASLRAAACAVSVLLAGAAFAEARRVEVPLVLPLAFLERLLIEQVFNEPERSARIVAGADPCNEIVLREPTLRPLAGRLVVTARGRAQAGFSLFGSCYRPFEWEGRIEADEEARVARGAPAVEFRVLNSWLEDESRLLAVPALWDWVKPEVHPRLEALRVDLAPLVGELRQALPLFASRREEPALRRLVDSLTLADARVEERGLVLRLRFDVEAAAPANATPAPEPPLGPDELAAFETTLHEWDAFLTFVIKAAGHDTLDPALRATLLGVLIEGRQEIVAALAEPERDGEDRVRALFVSSWTRLQPALAPLVGSAPGLRYLAFVASGDALAALDAAAPSFGFEVSRDGLRRLARTLAPDATEDPLLYRLEVDPELRETFGFDVELPALPPPSEPEPGPRPEPASEPAPGAALRWLDWLLPAAFAAPELLRGAGPYSSALDGFAPRIADLDGYLPEIATLLRESSRQVFAHGKLEAERRELFERLMLATAWQESCWRQYVRRRGAVAPLRSSVGALGLMQVNPHVWRGFYAVDGLAWSIGYNARAGGEILLHYLRDYAIARGEEEAGGPDALARATYAVYHGGPSHLRRYRHPKKWRAALVAVDRAFHAKFREVEAGRELGVRECFPG